MVACPLCLRCRRLLGLALLAAASIAPARGAPARPERPDPLDPRARVPAVTTPTPFAGYRRLGDDKPVPWKEANETVGRIGGWRAYAREAQVPVPAASAPAAGAAPGHGGHETQ